MCKNATQIDVQPTKNCHVAQVPNARTYEVFSAAGCYAGTLAEHKARTLHNLFRTANPAEGDDPTAFGTAVHDPLA